MLINNSKSAWHLGFLVEGCLWFVARVVLSAFCRLVVRGGVSARDSPVSCGDDLVLIVYPLGRIALIFRVFSVLHPQIIPWWAKHHWASIETISSSFVGRA